MARSGAASFLVAVKASRLLTHMKRLRDPGEPLARLFSRAGALIRRLGPVLYQLPGNFTSMRHVWMPLYIRCRGDES